MAPLRPRCLAGCRVPWLVIKMNAQPLKLIVWNVHGLNAQARRNAVYQVVNSANPAIVCLQETKLQDVFVRQCLGNKFEKFFYLPAAGTPVGSWWLGMRRSPNYQARTILTIR